MCVRVCVCVCFQLVVSRPTSAHRDLFDIPTGGGGENDIDPPQTAQRPQRSVSRRDSSRQIIAHRTYIARIADVISDVTGGYRDDERTVTAAATFNYYVDGGGGVDDVIFTWHPEQGCDEETRCRSRRFRLAGKKIARR